MRDEMALNREFQTTDMQKAEILKVLRKKGCRITKQRELLVDIILQGEFLSCKEIYYKALRKDPRIGMATIYRMMNLMEEIGALRWRNGYQICFSNMQPVEKLLVTEFGGEMIELGKEEVKNVLRKGLEQCEYSVGEIDQVYTGK